MPELTFVIPNYSRAMIRFVEQVMRGFVALHPILGSIPWKPTEHQGPVRNVRSPSPLDQRVPPIRSEGAMPLDTIRNTDFDDFARFLDELAHSQIGQLMSEFYTTINGVTAATGNVVDGGGQLFSFDMLNDALEKVDIDFDSDGNPILPTLITDPAAATRMRSLEPTSEQTERHRQIIARKKAEHDAKKRSRRLS